MRVYFPNRSFAWSRRFSARATPSACVATARTMRPPCVRPRWASPSTATDVAKAAAGIVLTEPGLGGIVTCIKEGRAEFQRILTYTLTILVNKCATLVVMGAGLVITGHAVLTPLLQALSMLTGDFVTMARAADRARPSPYPNAWRIRNVTIAAIPLGSFKLSYCVCVLAAGWYWLASPPSRCRP